MACSHRIYFSLRKGPPIISLLLSLSSLTSQLSPIHLVPLQPVHACGGSETDGQRHRETHREGKQAARKARGAGDNYMATLRVLADKAVEDHVERLRVGRTGFQEGVLIGTVRAGLAQFAPEANLSARAPAVENSELVTVYALYAHPVLADDSVVSQASIERIDACLPGGLCVVGVYSFTASADNHLPRLISLRPPASRERITHATWTVIQHVSNSTKCTVRRRQRHEPADLRFTNDLCGTFASFRALVSVDFKYAPKDSHHLQSLATAVASAVSPCDAAMKVEGVLVSQHHSKSVLVSALPAKSPGDPLSVEICSPLHTSSSMGASASGSRECRHMRSVSGAYSCGALAHENDSLAAVKVLLTDDLIRTVAARTALKPGVGRRSLPTRIWLYDSAELEKRAISASGMVSTISSSGDLQESARQLSSALFQTISADNLSRAEASISDSVRPGGTWCDRQTRRYPELQAAQEMDPDFDGTIAPAALAGEAKVASKEPAADFGIELVEASDDVRSGGRTTAPKEVQKSEEKIAGPTPEPASKEPAPAEQSPNAGAGQSVSMMTILGALVVLILAIIAGLQLQA